jgi:arginine/lysine/ornithine decarboxylase
VLDPSAGGEPGCHGVDPLRVTIGVAGTGLTGYDLARRLRRREDIELESAGHDVIVALFGLGEPAGPSGARLVEGLSRVLDDAIAGEPPTRPEGHVHQRFGPLVMSPRRAYLGRRVAVPSGRAAGRVCAETLVPYPPGIPLALPGERLTEEVMRSLLSAIDDGATIRGASDPRLASVQVVASPPITAP